MKLYFFAVTIMALIFLTWLEVYTAIVHQGKRFGSELYDKPQLVSRRELYVASRTSFETEDLLQDILEGAQKKYRMSKVVGTRLTYTLSAGAAFSTFVLPSLDKIDIGVKNLLGLGALFAPFGSLLLLQYGSEVIEILVKSPSSNESRDKERICYHEAGHFIVGYLSGLGIEEYNINGQIDSGLSFDTETLQMDQLLTCAMAGTVAEFLRFGDCVGGGVDISIAVDALQQSGVRRGETVNSYLRFGALKALTLLRLYRDALDDIAVEMGEGKSIFDLVKIIENCELEH